MTRRKLENRNIRKLGKGKTSYYITIPIEAIRELGWKKFQKVVVDVRRKQLVIKDWES